MIDAFARVNQEFPEAALAIVGGGVLDVELQAQIENLGLQNDVVLVGRRNDVPRLLAASDVFVSASLWEGLPIVILEGMSAGLPIVATTVGDVPNVIDENTGVLVAPKQPEALAQAISQYLKDPSLVRKHGDAAKHQVELNFSPDAWANKITNLYQEVVEKKLQ